MQFLLDHIVATIVAGVIFLMLFSVKLRTQEATINAMNNYALTTQELDFIEVLKRDLHSASILDDVEEVVSATDTTFSFWAQLDPPSTDSTHVVYKRTKVGERNGVPLYQIKRTEDGVAAGASMVTMTEWFIEARNLQGGTITNPADAGQIFVQFEAAAPFKDDENVKRSRWEATFHPPLLRGNMLL